MKTALLLVGGAICMSARLANDADTNSNPSPAMSETVIASQGPDFSGHSMSGGAAVPLAKSGPTFIKTSCARKITVERRTSNSFTEELIESTTLPRLADTTRAEGRLLPDLARQKACLTNGY